MKMNYRLVFLLINVWSVSLVTSILSKAKDSQGNVTDSEEARVEEIPHPAMTVQNGQQYPGYYTFNNGEPFFVEKDPLTGAFDFNKKTLSAPERTVTQTDSTSNRDKEEFEDSDYIYDDQQFAEEQIDRKDTFSTSHNYRPNDILKNPYKVSPDLHQFLNLPVHYSSSDKFPLISSSYANTKIQGTGSSSYSNHKYVTSSTTTHSPPSYYTFRQTSTSERPTISTTTMTTKPTTTTTVMPEDEYENPEEFSYLDYDVEEQYEKVSTTPATTTTLAAATTTTTENYPITTYRPKVNFTSTPSTTTESKQTQHVSIVTSLPLDMYYSKEENTTVWQGTSSTTDSPKTEQSQFYRPSEQLYPVVEEPFIPIVGPSKSHLINRPEPQQQNKSVPQIPVFQRLPEDQSQTPSIIGIEPPRPDPPQDFFSGQPIQLSPGQHATVTFSEPSKSNTVTRPVQDHIFQTSQNINKINRPLYHSPSEQTSIPSSNEAKLEQAVYPHQRPTVLIPPILQQGQFKEPSKVQKHVIKVSPGQENPSYSLQTSFSIGVPSSESTKHEQQNIRPGQGIGQVLFPDKSEPEISGTTPPQRIRKPIQTYQPNRPGLRQPIHIEPPIAGLRPPAQVDKYPRPHWEIHSKPAFYNVQPQSPIPNHEVVLPPHFPGVNRLKPDVAPSQHSLPNILPQFRPNAKIGQADYHTPREPLDTLQPPPLPRPQHLRINRNDEESEIDEEIQFSNEKSSTPFPLVHHRTGPQPNARVTTLQMMHQIPPRRTLVRPEYPIDKNTSPEKDRPVFLVYPSSNYPKKHQPSEGVVIGIRGSQRPLPPSNLEKDELDTFPLDENKNFPIPGRDRVDTPILKTKSTPKPLMKNEFPYTIIRPAGSSVSEERILSGHNGPKDYTAFSPTATPNKDEIRDHDSEVNIIPYLQDYMPFAMKKQSTTIKPENKSPKPLQENQPISVTLNTNLAVTTSKPNPTTELNYHEPISKNSGESEFTVSAVMHTHKQKPSITNHRPIESTINEAPSRPKPIDLEAPFQASLSAPESHGWSVVRPSGEQVNHENERVDETDTEVFSKKPDEESKFDIENFKPQLFGGFQPIMPPFANKEDNASRDKHELDIFKRDKPKLR